MHSGEVRLRYDNEPSLVQLMEEVKAFRSPRQTTLETVIRAEHDVVGAIERAHRTLQANARALKLDIRARADEAVIPGQVLFPWTGKHVG